MTNRRVGDSGARIVECKCRQVHVSEFSPESEYAVAILGLDPWKVDVSECEVHRPKPAPTHFSEQGDGTFEPIIDALAESESKPLNLRKEAQE